MNSIAEAGGKVTGVVADVRDFTAVGRAFETACAQFGSIDVLVSRAAGNFLAPINELSPNGFRVVVDIDLIGTFHMMRAAFPRLTKPGGFSHQHHHTASLIPMHYRPMCAVQKPVSTR